MSIAELLLKTAQSDLDLLGKNAAKEDDVSIPRDLDFVLYAKDEERAKLVQSFVTDNSYGRPFVQRVEQPDGRVQWRLVVQILAPATPEVVCTLSGFMACLSKIYDLDYDGWGCVLQRAEPSDGANAAHGAPRSSS